MTEHETGEYPAPRPRRNWGVAFVTIAVVATGTALYLGNRPEPLGDLKQLWEADEHIRNRHWDADGFRVVLAEPAEVRKAHADLRARVLAWSDRDMIVTPEDRYHAARILAYGTDLREREAAHRQARAAAEAGFQAARRLAASTLDHLLQAQGKPQRYGYAVESRDGHYRLYPVDPSVTDQERAEWDSPPLEKAEAMAEALNLQ